MGRALKAALVAAIAVAACAGPAGRLAAGQITPADVGGALSALVPHRAYYALSLKSTIAGSSLSDARGAMFLEWADSCEGYSSSQRLQLRFFDAERPTTEVDSRFASWESLDGLSYRFDIENFRNGVPDQEMSGHAALEGPGKGGTVEYTGHTQKDIALPPGTMFPVKHMMDLLARAEKGQKIVERTVFDGTDEQGPFDINAVIGLKKTPDSSDPNEKIIPRSVDGPYWPMRLAFFHTNDNSEVPFYEMTVELMANGIARSFLLDYGDSVIQADLKRIDILKKPHC